MADPMTLFSVATTLIGAFGADKAGKQRQKALERQAAEQARLNEISAKEAIADSIEDEKVFRMARRQDQGANIAALGASGISMGGSALDVLRENTRLAEVDAGKILAKGERSAAEFRRAGASGIAEARAQGREARRAGEFGAAATLLGGAAKAYDIYDRTNKKPKKGS